MSVTLADKALPALSSLPAQLRSAVAAVCPFSRVRPFRTSLLSHQLFLWLEWFPLSSLPGEAVESVSHSVMSDSL